MEKIKRVTAYSKAIENSDEEFVSELSEFDEQGNEILNISYMAPEQIEHKVETEYDENGHKIAEKNYTEEDEISEAFRFERDNSGLVLTETIVYMDGSESIKEFKRDSQAHTVEITTHDEDGELEERVSIKLDSNDNVLKLQMFDEDNQLAKEEINTIEDNKLVRKQVYESGQLMADYSYTYNDKDLLTSQTNRSPKGELIERIVLEYDDLGRMIKQQIGNRYAVVNEYDDENRIQVEKRILGNGMIDMQQTTHKDETGKITLVESLQTQTRYVYEFYANQESA